LENKVMTATPEQLQLMLYEAAVRFAQQCAAAVAERDFERAHTAYERCDAVLCELQSGLRPDVHRDVAENLRALYAFCQARMDEGSLRCDAKAIEDAILILRHLRETWILVMEQLAREDRPEAPAPSSEECVLAVET
jgi:flagellar protein FliS